MDGKLVIAAKQEIGLYVGGTYIKLTPEGIENGTAGQIFERCANWSVTGPNTQTVPLPAMPGAQYEQFYELRDTAGKPLPGCLYQLTRPDGRVTEGYTDAKGKTGVAYSNSVAPVNCEALPDQDADIIRASYWDEDTPYDLDFARPQKTEGDAQ